MKRKITCYCDSSFEIDTPTEINLDKNPEYLDEILEGSFFSFECKKCRKKHKPEYPLKVIWEGKKLNLEVLPEQERNTFYKKSTKETQKSSGATEVLIGYPEMADRLAVIKEGLNPLIIETIKYYLHLKAEEEKNDGEIHIWFYAKNKGKSAKDASLEFHIHGLTQNEIAKMQIPLALYEKTMEDYKSNPKNEIYKALKFHNYLSVKNTIRAETYPSGRS